MSHHLLFLMTKINQVSIIFFLLEIRNKYIYMIFIDARDDLWKSSSKKYLYKQKTRKLIIRLIDKTLTL